jgi:hypothetical protein
MKTISLTSPSHNFQKVNGMTLRDKTSLYDLYECSHCKLQGKRRGFSDELEVRSIKPCIGEDKLLNQDIQVVRCGAVGNAFENLTPGSIHRIVTPPTGYMNGTRGVWVMGVGEPVLLLYGEFSFLN